MAKITRVVAVANRKGGVGKSTTTMLLAAALAVERSRRVIILDCDEQQSAADVAHMETVMYPGAATVVEVRVISPVFVRDFLSAHGAQYDVVFIDVPRITETATGTALGQILALCDCVLVPALGAQLDAVSTVAFLRMVREIADYKRANAIPFQFFGFINRSSTRKDNVNARAFLVEAGLPMFNAALPDLKIFASPSVYFSPMATAEGRRRFAPFFDEFCKRFKM